MHDLLGKRIAVIGAGNIGRILLERLLTSGIPAEDSTICDTDPARAAKEKTARLQKKLKEGSP